MHTIRSTAYVLLLVSWSLAAEGQTTEFPNAEGIWSILRSSSSAGTTTSYTSTLYVGGDSIYNDHTYNKIFITPDTVASGGYVLALLRTDSSGLKVYCIAWRDTTENLLYDFGLDAGESSIVFPASFGEGTEVTVTVDQVDTILVGGVYRRRQRLNGWYSGRLEYWIEGIGSTEGLLDAGLSSYLLTDVFYPFLYCYQENGETIYRSEYAQSCFLRLPSGMGTYEERNPIELFPNPIIEHAIVRTTTGTGRIHVYDALGHEVFSQEIEALQERVDFSGLSKGLYIVVLFDGMTTTARTVWKYGS